MRIIIKPMGAAVLLIAITLLSVLAFHPGRGERAEAQTRIRTAKTQEEGDVLLAVAPEAWNLVQVPAKAMAVTPHALAQLPGGNTRAIRVEVLRPTPSTYWFQAVTHDVPAKIVQRHRMTLHFWARSSSAGTLCAVVEQAQQPWKKEAAQQMKLTHEWEEKSVSFVASSDYPAGSAHIGFQMGFGAGQFELADVRLTDSGVAAS